MNVSDEKILNEEVRLWKLTTFLVLRLCVQLDLKNNYQTFIRTARSDSCLLML